LSKGAILIASGQVPKMDTTFIYILTKSNADRKRQGHLFFYAAQARYGKLHNRCLMATDKAQSLFRIFKRALWQ
jgi:hypothetical protein